MEQKNFDKLIGIKGFSEQLLRNHFELYKGYIANFTKLNDMLIEMEKQGKSDACYSELNRRFGWEFNGMRLHELYFGNLTKKQTFLGKNSRLLKELTRQFGSYEAWERDFKQIGMMRSIGWVILYYDKDSKQLFNIWINEHDAGHLAGAVPILVMDVFEHAYMIDYGLKKADYIEYFFKAVDWNIAEKRFR